MKGTIFVRSAIFAAVMIVFTGEVAWSQASTGNNDPEKTFAAYVEATRTKDIPVLTKVIADDYMTINGDNKLATKKSEIEEAKQNPSFDKMQLDEVHSLVIGGTAVVSGIISAAYTNRAGKPIEAKVRVLATLLKRRGVWQIVADESAPTH